VGAITGLLAIGALGLAGWNWMKVQGEAQKLLPGNYNELAVRYELLYMIWTPQISNRARSRYVLFHVWAVVASVLLSATCAFAGSVGGSVTFLTLAVIGLISILWQVLRFRLSPLRKIPPSSPEF
jgi:FtsH-binding integral membrane protein